jgi:hypothetical protein
MSTLVFRKRKMMYSKKFCLEIILILALTINGLSAFSQCQNYTVSTVLSGACPTASQITWQLIGSDGTLWLSGGAPYSTVVCLPDDCYTLNMLDTGGDGWDCVDWFIADFIGVLDFDTNLPNGNFGTDTFEAGLGNCAGGGGGGNSCPIGTDVYDFNIDNGDFPSQISWVLSLGGLPVLSGGANYNQDVCLAPGCYVFEMFDSANNGWNNAEYKIKDPNNVVIYQNTLASGNYGFVVFDLGIGDCNGITPGGGGGGGVIPGSGCGSAPPTADCSTAACVCDNYNFHISPTGFGTFNDIPSPGSFSNPSISGAPPWGGSAPFGCLLAGELNSNWMIFTVGGSGTLQFSMGQNSTIPQAGYYDWAMWPYNGVTTCANISGNLQAPVRCVWNSVSFGGTGLAAPIPAGGNAGNYAPPLNVIAGQQYIICMSNYSFANTNVVLDFFGTAVIQCATVLPVEMIRLEAYQTGNNVMVEWSTATEENCHHFVVEKSDEGFNWSKVGEVVGHGTTTSRQDYQLLDRHPFGGESFYRVIQYDNNGMFKATDPVDIFMKDDGISIYPNPADNLLTIRGVRNSDLEIFSTAGKLQFRKVMGENGSLEVETSQWADGVYYLKCNFPSGIVTHRIVVVHN